MSLSETLDDRQFFRPREVSRLTGLSKSKVMAAIRTGALRARKLDGCILIAREDMQRYLDEATPMTPRAS